MDHKELKIRIARLYYHNHMAKTEIGKKFRISRFKVAQYLEEAQDEGIIEIIINEVSKTSRELEILLEKKFDIGQARVAATSVDYDKTKKNIGKIAALILEELTHNGDIIGVAWGTTLYEMLNCLDGVKKFKNISVVQLTGGLHQIEMDYSPVELTRRMARIFEAEVYQLYVPAIVDSHETLEVLTDDRNIKKTLEMFPRVNIALVGIGSVYPRPSTMLSRDGYIDKNDVERIINSGAVGDINAYFYNLEGDECSTGLDGRTIGIGLSQLKKIRYAVGVAGGIEKAEAIYGALKGGIINIIITDAATAEKVLSIG